MARSDWERTVIRSTEGEDQCAGCGFPLYLGDVAYLDLGAGGFSIACSGACVERIEQRAETTRDLVDAVTAMAGPARG